MAKFNYDNWDEDYFDSELEFGKGSKKRSKPKKNNGKGHQSVHSKRRQWEDELIEDDNFLDLIVPQRPFKKHYTKPDPKPDFKEANAPQNTTTTIPQEQDNFSIGKPRKEFVPGPNTHEIKTIEIDFDRVENMEKVDGTYNEKITFGIKFTFTGKFKNSRTIWFNQNARERDAVFNKEYGFWRKIVNANLGSQK